MRRLTLLGIAVALSSTGCFFESDHDHHPARGTLVVDWTVDGAKRPSECTQGGADRIDILVYTAGGSFVGEFEEFCEAFETSIRLRPGAYSLDAALIDLDGFERTTAVEDRFVVYSYETTVSALDFPADSFL